VAEVPYEKDKKKKKKQKEKRFRGPGLSGRDEF
jgi:hypothetical protein